MEGPTTSRRRSPAAAALGTGALGGIRLRVPRIDMRLDLLDHLLVVDACEGRPRERSECFGHDLRGATTLRAGLYVDKVN
jgi:hypothetical protein